MSSWRSWLLSISLVLLVACGAAPSGGAGSSANGTIAGEGEEHGSSKVAVEGLAIAQGEPSHPWTPEIAPGAFLPVTSADPTWGDADAPVTIVAFEDLQCPFCADATKTLEALMESYGPHTLRIVFKHEPLARHPHAREAADVGAAIFAIGGSDAFFAYARTIFRELRENPEADFRQIAIDGVASAADVAPISGKDIKDVIARGGASKVDADLDLAKHAGANGTPTFFINGIMLVGAQDESRFREIIDAEVFATKDAVQHAMTATLYADRLAANVSAGKNKDAGAQRKPEPPDPKVHFVPIDGSPVRGSAAAPVTIVEFADFECPYCRKAAATLETVRAKYGDKVRVVFKHLPLPMHERAEPSSELAIAIFKKKGNDAFWKAYDQLFAADGQLADSDLEGVAKSAGLDPKAALADVGAKKYAPVIEADGELADDLDTSSTPQFFINGKRLKGNQPAETFEAAIDAALASAEALAKSGTRPAGVYDAIMKTAEHAAPPETRTPPAVASTDAVRGAKNAPVTIQVFADFQCPYCRKIAPIMEALEKEHRGKVRIVWRHRPLDMHKYARTASIAAIEARRQKGDDGFWKFHDALFEASASGADGLARPELEKIAAAQGLDMKAFDAALDRADDPAELTADEKAATDADVRGTPTVFVNDFIVVGAHSNARYEKLVRAALAGKK